MVQAGVSFFGTILVDGKQGPCHVRGVARAVIGNLREVRQTVRKQQATGELDASNVAWRDGSYADWALGRVRPGNVIVVGGRTNSGKSLFSLLMQVDNLGRSAYLSLEDDAEEVARRIESVADEDAERIVMAQPVEYTSGAIIKAIDEVALVDSWDLYAECKLVVLDYLQLITYSGSLPAFSRTEAVAHIIADLRRHARDKRYALVLNAQINRPPRPSAPGKRSISEDDDPDAAYRADPPRPSLFDLKDSASIENAATFVLLVHGRQTWADVTLAKNKSGPVGARQRYARTENGWFEPI
jgi:hypothetical protein